MQVGAKDHGKFQMSYATILKVRPVVRLCAFGSLFDIHAPAQRSLLL